MTQSEYRDICMKLSHWMKERHITISQQRENFKKLIEEEYREYILADLTLKDTPYDKVFSAPTIKHLHDKVDAICDMIVVTNNAQANYEGAFFTIEILEDGFEYSISSLCELLENLGFNPYLCMLECIKHISARTGKWDEKVGKWIKDESSKSIPQPNYFKHIIDSTDTLPTTQAES